MALMAYLRLQRTRAARVEKERPYNGDSVDDESGLMENQLREGLSHTELPGRSSHTELPGVSSHTELPGDSLHQELPEGSVHVHEMSVKTDS